MLKQNKDTVINIKYCDDCPFCYRYGHEKECVFNTGFVVNPYAKFGGVNNKDFKCPLREGSIVLKADGRLNKKS